MIALNTENIRSILCIGAHADDIEIGCGGTLLKIFAENSSIDVHWLVLSGLEQRIDEAFKSSEEFLQNISNKTVSIKNFRDSFFPYCGLEIKEFFNQFKRECNPDLIFTHQREDMHQDHRLVSELTWNTFRNHLIFEYEIPKYEGDLGHPNVFVRLDESICKRKIEVIYNTFQTQRSKNWFTEDTFWSLLRIRGVESNSIDKYAEAFYCRKLVI